MVVVLVDVVVVVAVVIVTVVAGVFATTCSRVVMFLFQVSIFTIFCKDNRIGGESVTLIFSFNYVEIK